MKVSEAMHRTVAWVDPATPVAEIAKIMKEQDIGAVPVGENDRLVGMVTDRDIVLRAFGNRHDVSELTARDVMTAGITYCRTDNKLEEAIHMMEEKKIRRMPVINESKRMVGMLSLGDVSHAGGMNMTNELVAAVTEHHA